LTDGSPIKKKSIRIKNFEKEKKNDDDDDDLVTSRRNKNKRIYV